MNYHVKLLARNFGLPGFTLMDYITARLQEEGTVQSELSQPPINFPLNSY